MALGGECAAACREFYGRRPGRDRRQPGQPVREAGREDDELAVVGQYVEPAGGVALPVRVAVGVQCFEQPGDRVPWIVLVSILPLLLPPSILRRGKSNLQEPRWTSKDRTSATIAGVLCAPRFPPSAVGDLYDAVPDNFSAYGRHILDIVPVMFTMFTDSSADPQQPPWSDTRSVYMRAKDVALGSRVPPPLSSWGTPISSSVAWMGFGLVVTFVWAILTC